MEKIFRLLFVALFFVLCIPEADAQGILGRIKRRAQNAIENKVNTAVDRAVDGAVEGVVNGTEDDGDTLSLLSRLTRLTLRLLTRPPLQGL